MTFPSRPRSGGNRFACYHHPFFISIKIISDRLRSGLSTLLASRNTAHGQIETTSFMEQAR